MTPLTPLRYNKVPWNNENNNNLFPDRTQEPPPPMVIDSQPEYEVETIIGTRKHRNRREYLIKWKGYGSHENSWEPATHLTNAKDLISEFNNQQTISSSILTITTQLDKSPDKEPTIELCSLKRGDRFNEVHQQSQQLINTTSNATMNNQIFDTPIKNAILRCTESKAGKLYWITTNVPQGFHVKNCQCRFCTNINKCRKNWQHRKCYKCGSKNHLYADCPDVKSSTYNTKKRQSQDEHNLDWLGNKIAQDEQGWGTDNPNFETQDLDPNWINTTPLTYVEPKLSDRAEHWQKCFKKGRCEHGPLYSPEDDCLSCWLMFDEKGNRIHYNSPSNSPIPYSPVTLKDEDEDFYIISNEEHMTQELNKKSCELIKDLTQTYTLLDTVFPDILYKEKTSHNEALDRRNQLTKVQSLAKATFPANYNCTYLDARQAYFQFRGYCNHHLTFRTGHPHCGQCPESDTKLQGYHAQDYHYYLEEQLKATFWSFGMNESK